MIYDVPSVDHSMIHPPAQQVVIPYREMPKAPSVPAIDVSKFSQKLAKRAAYRSSSQCAKFVRIALQSAGANIVQHPVAASDWGRTLQQIGYQKIKPEFNNPQPGDIYIIHRTKNIVMGILLALPDHNGSLTSSKPVMMYIKTLTSLIATTV